MSIDALSPETPGLDYILRKTRTAAVLGISATSLWRLESAGLLKPVEIIPGVAGFRASDVKAFIASRPPAALNTARMAKALASPKHGRPRRVVAASEAARG